MALRYTVVTNLEPTYASCVFINFDDPHFKANITLSLVYPKGAQVYANEPRTNNNDSMAIARSVSDLS